MPKLEPGEYTPNRNQEKHEAVARKMRRKHGIEMVKRLKLLRSIKPNLDKRKRA